MDILSPGDPSHQNWRKINAAARLQDRRAAQLRQREARHSRWQFDRGEGMHPFKIYLAQPIQLANIASFDFSTAWRAFTVRAGNFFGTDLTGQGCDGHNLNPDDDSIPAETDDGHAVIPIVATANTAKYYFWVDYTAQKPTLQSGADPTAAVTDPTLTAWLNFPSFDPVHLLIGQVNTSATPGYAPIRQFLRFDLPAAGQISGCNGYGNFQLVYVPWSLKSA